MDALDAPVPVPPPSPTHTIPTTRALATRRCLQTYGYDKIFTLNNLEKIGLLRKAEPRNNFATLRKVCGALVSAPATTPDANEGVRKPSVRVRRCASR